MSKKIIYLLIITFVCVLLSGCVRGDADETSPQVQNETETDTEAETEIAIEEDAEMEVKYLMTEDELEWLNSMIGYYKLGDTPEEAVEHKDYHGKIGDCFIISNDFELGTASVIIVGGYRFVFTHYALEVYHRSGRYSLRGAYKEGILSEQDLARLNEYYSACMGEYVFGGSATAEDYIILKDSPIALTSDEAIYIVEAFWEEESIWFLNHSNPYMDLSCYGKFDDVYAVFIKEASSIPGSNPTTETVNGVELTYPTSLRIRICYDGKIYLLPEAAEAGIVTTEQIQVIADNLKEWQK